MSDKIFGSRKTRKVYLLQTRSRWYVRHARQQMIAGARLVKSHSEAEFAVIVADEHQSRGLGTELCRRLLGIARTEGVKRLTGSILPENIEMRAICNRLGFHPEYDTEGLVRVDIALAKESQ